MNTGRRRLSRYRTGAHIHWVNLSTESDDFHRLFARLVPGIGCRWLEVAGPEGDDGIQLQLVDLPPVLGTERASYIRVCFAQGFAAAELVRLAEWVIMHLPLWWGAVGLTFRHVHGSLYSTHRRMAALAKRYWGVQIQDLTALQWDALLGMPGVNWLSLIGNEFAQSKELDIGSLADSAVGLAGDGVFLRKGKYGLALAAGPAPLLGDININEDLTAYVKVAKLIQPLLLTEHTLLSGPFSDPKVMGAWLGRFADPQAWLDCDIASD